MAGLHYYTDGSGRTWNGSKWIRPKKRAAIYERDGYRCVYCGGEAELLDHVLPRPKGSNYSSNLVSCCYSCNTAKGDRSAVEFAFGHLDDPGAALARVVTQTMIPLKGYREREPMYEREPRVP